MLRFGSGHRHHREAILKQNLNFALNVLFCNCVATDSYCVSGFILFIFQAFWAAYQFGSTWMR